MFCIGDRVVPIRPVDGNSEVVGRRGIVCRVDHDTVRRLPILVEFKESFTHPINREKLTFWWCEEENLQLESVYQFNKLVDEYYQL